MSCVVVPTPTIVALLGKIAVFPALTSICPVPNVSPAPTSCITVTTVDPMLQVPINSPTKVLPMSLSKGSE